MGILSPFGASWDVPSFEQLPSRALMTLSSDSGLVPSGIEEATTMRECQHKFTGFEDYSGRGERAARMLHGLRSVGQWSLHVVDFPEWFVNRHGAIICHPAALKNHFRYGKDVVQHVAAVL